MCRDKRKTEEGKGEEETVACVSYCTVPEPWFHDRGACSALLHCQTDLSKRFSLAAYLQSGDSPLCVS